MPSPSSDPRTRHWYKVSVDAVRAWTTILAVVVIATAGFWGYRLLSQHLLEREVFVAIEEAETLLERLAGEEGIDAYRDRVEVGAQHVAGARELYGQGELRDARDEAERGRTLLSSVADALRHRSPAGEAQFISTHGRVEIRRGERGEWRPARGRMVLNAGDYIKTSANGSAEIMMVDGTLFTVRPETVLLVSRSRSALGIRSERTLSLESGWVNLSTASSVSRITTPDAEAMVQERSEAVVAYDSVEKVGRFSNYRGRVRVASSDGVTRDVGELEQVVQTDLGLSEVQSLPAAPEILDPEDNLEFSRATTETVVLSWKPVQGAAAYALQVSRNRLFVDNIIDVADRAKTTATLGVRGEGSFVWRVAAVAADSQQGPWSTAYRFRIGGRGNGTGAVVDQERSVGG